MGIFLYNRPTLGMGENGNTVMKMGGNAIEKVIPAHLYSRL